MARSSRENIESLLAQACHYIDATSGGVSPPIQPSTTYARDSNYQLTRGYSYGRSGNPGYELLEKLCAELDGGAEALCFASGMAAITAVFETLESGDHVVAPRIMYHGALDWLLRISKKRGIGLSLFEPGKNGALQEAIEPGKTRLVWIETPVNPTWEVIDIAAAADMAHQVGAQLAVDCTVSTPLTTRALELGADIVFHSATKYYNGHSDVIAGLLVTRAVDPRWQEIRLVRTLVGGVLGPFEAWLLLRGMRTMFIRFEKACSSALRIANHFEGHEKLEAVLYPGLASHASHAIAKKQMLNGFGGMMSLMLRGDAEQAKRFASSTQMFIPATSLGGVESLIEHRASVEGPNSLVPKNLVRLSIGIENCDDLIVDLEQALDKS